MASGEINPENLNRCFVIGIDESEDQLRLIHEVQRRNHTLDGFLQKKDLDKIINKHINAQWLRCYSDKTYRKEAEKAGVCFDLKNMVIH